MRHQLLATLVTPALAASLLLNLPTSALAAAGDCGQPVSSGNAPVATDALFTLQAAVGSQECDECTCDASGDGNVAATDALVVLQAAVGQVVGLFCAPLCFTFVCDPDNDEDADMLTDCQEVEETGTNPFIEDTDGDGLTDGQEIFEFAFDPVQNPFLFNPRIADVPQLSFVLTTAPEINVIGTLTSGASYESGTRNLQASEKTFSTSKTDTETHRTEMTMSAELSFESVVKKMIPPKSASPARVLTDTLGGSLGFSRTTSDETSVSYNTTSSSAMRRESETTQSEVIEMGVENTEGKIEIAADISNAGNQTFGVSEFGLSVLRRDPIERTTFVPVAQLGKAVFNRNDDGDFPTLAPGGVITNQIFSSDTGAMTIEVTAQEALDLLADPSGLVINVSGYELEVVVNRGAGVEPVRIPWSANEQLVQQKTAAVIIDYGPPPFPVQERFLVATNTHFDGDINSVPTPLGMPVGEILRDVLGFEYETEVLEVRNVDTDLLTARVRRLVELVRPNGQGTFTADESIDSSWSVYTDATSVEVFDNTTFSSTMDPFHDFEDIILRKTNKLHLVYREDRDLDGLGKREEFLYNTDDEVEDTDEDGLTDFGEVRTGWSIEVVGADPYMGFSDPTVTDTDGDGISDFDEFVDGTDPRVLDTDMDGATDDAEKDFGTDPLDPDDPPFPLNAVLFFSFTGFDSSSGIVMDDGENGNDGLLVQSGPPVGKVTNAPNRFGIINRAVEFRPDANSRGIIDIGARPELDGPFTVSFWATADSRGVVLAQRGGIGESSHFDLRMGSGGLEFTVRDPENAGQRLTFDDNTSLSGSAWHHFAVVVDYDQVADTSLVRFYRDGQLLAGVGGSFDGKYDNAALVTEMTSGAVISCSTISSSDCYCNMLITVLDCTNQQSGGLDGFLDDFRIHARPLNSAEILDLFNAVE